MYKFLAVILVVCLGYIVLHSSSDENQIRSLVLEATELAQIKEDSLLIDQLKQASRAAKLVDSPFVFIELEERGEQSHSFTPEEIRSKLLAAIKLIGSLKVSLSTLELEITSNQATALIRAAATGTHQHDNEDFLDLHLAEVKFTKKNGTWLISEVRHLENERGEDL